MEISYHVMDTTSGTQVPAQICPAMEKDFQRTVWEHYIRDYGTAPFSRAAPYLLLLEGEAAGRLFSQFLKGE